MDKYTLKDRGALSRNGFVQHCPYQDNLSSDGLNYCGSWCPMFEVTEKEVAYRDKWNELESKFVSCVILHCCGREIELEG